MPIQSKDRRRDPRVTVWSPLILTADGESFPATLQNVSLAGVGCTCGQAHDTGTRLGMQLQLPTGDGDPLKLTVDAQVVRCDRVRKGSARERYRLGLAFEALDEAQLRDLKSFLDWSFIDEADAP